ncbi:uncharacterized protein V1518DRAFT_412263 [Limtongia smithiae]|uniref:uncharacterized protein n=1 Tax=Limtongia smithiae TaxID=1125753 RepID=UPI0034CF0587
MEDGGENAFRPLYKFYRRLPHSSLDPDAGVAFPDSNLLDPRAVESYEKAHPHAAKLHVTARTVSDCTLDALHAFIRASVSPVLGKDISIDTGIVEITVDGLPGLRIYPNALPPKVQQQLVVNVLEEYLPSPLHKTNLHISYDLPQPFNLFEHSDDTSIPPLPGSGTTSPTTLASLQNKKLRWVTLGGQYNWTTKEYPSFARNHPSFPAFPADLADLLAATGAKLFRSPIVADAAIVNFYADGDILSPHQDVAELSRADLLSLSLGCEALFLCGRSRAEPPLQIRLRSGDVIVLGGECRYAWHGVARTWDLTAPDYLADFDFANGVDHTNVSADIAAGRTRYASWMQSKRININVRQMLDSE